MASAPPVWFVGGDKGGVGKSLVALSLLHHLQQRDQPVLLIETDTSNPDVWRCFRNESEIPSELVLLDRADGWISLVNHCAEYPDRAVVINTAARNSPGVTAYGGALNAALPNLERPLIALWVINRQRDCLELFQKFFAALPEARAHVLRNLYWGTEDKFELYNRSTLRKTIEGRGGLSLNFPELADRVADDLFTGRLNVARALQDLPLGNRAELRRWERECARLWQDLESHEALAAHREPVAAA